MRGRNSPRGRTGIQTDNCNAAGATSDILENVDKTSQVLAARAPEMADTLKQAQDPAALAALLAGQLEIRGITTDPGGIVSVTYGPKATA